MNTTEKNKPVTLGGMQSHTKELHNKGIGNEGTCPTEAATAAKEVTLGTTFELVNKATMIVTFTNGISVANATLAVTHTDLSGTQTTEAAYPIKYKGANLAANLVDAGSVLTLRLVYDSETPANSYWNVVGSLGSSYESKPAASGGTDVSLVTTGEKYTWNGKQDAISDLKVLGNAYLTCSTAGITAAKTIVDTGYILVPGCIVSVLFVNAFTSSNPTLNINDTGAKPIYYKGSAVQPGLIRANSVVVMQYNGTNYNIISYDSFARLVDDDAVDLGLPSGLLWCSHNVGAIDAKDFGLYFSWGNTDGHSEGDSYDFTLNAYNETKASTIPSSNGYTLGSDFDAARRIQGGTWRMPSWNEYQELFGNCQAEYTTLDSVVGMLFTSSINGNTLFFPNAGIIDGTTPVSTYGECWTSSGYQNNTARLFRFDSSGIITSGNPRRLRYNGVPVRAVM